MHHADSSSLLPIVPHPTFNTCTQVTKLGQLMSSFPLPPSLARVLLHARIVALAAPHLSDLAAVVAMLASETPFVRPPQKRAAEAAAHAKREMVARAGDDFNLLLYAFRSAEKACVVRGREKEEWKLGREERERERVCVCVCE